jgi:hypothetical protein
MYIDGDVFIAEGGLVERFNRGKSEGWDAAQLDDALLRPTLNATLVAGEGDFRQGVVYAYDHANARVIGYAKADGKLVAQYRLAGDRPDWDDLRGLYVLPGIDQEPSTLVWLSGTGVHQSVLSAVAAEEAGPSASPSGSGSPSGKPASPSASAGS